MYAKGKNRSLKTDFTAFFRPLSGKMYAKFVSMMRKWNFGAILITRHCLLASLFFVELNWLKFKVKWHWPRPPFWRPWCPQRLALRSWLLFPTFCFSFKVFLTDGFPPREKLMSPMNWKLWTWAPKKRTNLIGCALSVARRWLVGQL